MHTHLNYYELIKFFKHECSDHNVWLYEVENQNFNLKVSLQIVYLILSYVACKKCTKFTMNEKLD